MNEHVAITATLDIETIAVVDRLANARGISRTDFVAEAIRRVAGSDADFADFVQVGIDAADRGELTPQDGVFVDLRRQRQQRSQA